VVRQIHCTWLFIFLILFTVSSQADTTARVARHNVRSTDSFQVFFETDQNVSERPDFSPLKRDFEILSTSQSTSVNIVNMSMQRSSKWVVDLMAKREGELVVPAIIIGNEGTNIVKINVKPATAAVAGAPAGKVRMEVTVDNPAPYVQEQFIYTVRLLLSVPIGKASLTEPHVNGGDVIIEKLGDDAAYETTRGGDRVSVVERRYAMFAQNSGPITLEPLLFEAQITRGNRSRFDPFSRGQITRVRSDAIQINVQPIPTEFSGNIWLPAQQVLLSESTPNNQQEYRVGEPITRTLNLQATGLTASQLPEINAPVPPDIKQYPDQPALENRMSDGNMIALRQEKVALIPSQAGTFVLPAIEIPWWNTSTNRGEVASLQARRIEVLPALGTPSMATPVVSPATDSPQAAAATPRPPDEIPAIPRYWFWACLILGLGWLATILGWLWSRRHRTHDTPERQSPPDEKRLIAALKGACHAHDAPATKDALLEWARFNWPGGSIHSLGELTARLDFDLQKYVHELSQHLYQQSGSPWHGEALWQAFEAGRKKPSTKNVASKPGLEPLYL
jgi:hypothetical protein